MRQRHTSNFDVIDYIHQQLHAYNIQNLGEDFYPVVTPHDPFLHAIAAYDDQNQLCGGLVYKLRDQGNTFFVEFFFLKNSSRQQGSGSRLIAAAKEWAAELHCQKIRLCTHTFQAHKFYLKMGFQEASVTPCPIAKCPENCHYTLEFIL